MAIVVSATVSPKKYKRSWCYNRQLLFGRDLNIRYWKLKLAAIVDHIFSSHQGKEIKSFKLFINPVGIEVLLKKWLQICTEKDLENLELHLHEPGFTIESSVINALHKLKTLKLVQCTIQLPEVLNGLRFLQTLNLRDLDITEDMFVALIKHCKMLEVIELVHCSRIKKLSLIARENKHLKTLRICEDLEEIEIDSATLRTIFYCAKLPTIFRITQGVQLYEAFFYLRIETSKIDLQSTRLCMEALVKDLSHVSILTTTPVLIKGMAPKKHDGVYEESEYNFMNLMELQLFMGLGMFCNPYDLSMFLKNCPSLVKLVIDLSDYEFNLGLCWQFHQKPLLEESNIKFTKLKTVVLTSFKFVPFDLELVKTILQRATILERLVLIPSKINGYCNCKYKREEGPKYDKLFGSWRASTRATIEWHENDDEKNFANPTHQKFWFVEKIFESRV